MNPLRRFLNSRAGLVAFSGGFFFSGLALTVLLVAAVTLLGDPR